MWERLSKRKRALWTLLNIRVHVENFAQLVIDNFLSDSLLSFCLYVKYPVQCKYSKSKKKPLLIGTFKFRLKYIDITHGDAHLQY